MNNQLQLRDWQQIKQAMALKYAGTPEGAAALAESRRYGLAADRIEELSAQVEAMRELLEWVPMHGKTKPGIGDHVAVLTTDCYDDPLVVMACYNGSGLFLGAGGKKIKPANGWFALPPKGWRLPDASPAILHRRDAKVLDDAATTFHCRSLSGMVNGERITRDEMTGCLYATAMLRSMAAELAANHSLRNMTEADFNEAHGG